MGVFLFIVITGIVIIIVLKSMKRAKQKAKQKEEAEIELKARAELLGNELAKRRYEISYGDIKPVMGGHYEMFVWVSQENKSIGHMQIGTYGPGSDYNGSSYAMRYARDSYKINSFQHIIHLDRAGIIIESEVPCSEPPPEWMKICGQVLCSEGFTISFPRWMEEFECPGASKYVNVVFQQNGDMVSKSMAEQYSSDEYSDEEDYDDEDYD